jgi:CRISPR-associated protein Csb2
MFAFGIRYLNGFVVAAAPDDRDQVEWPPHPGRVFMALAAAYFQTGAALEERAALLWLESLRAAPVVSAPEAIQRSVVTHYVPVNDKAGPSKAILQSAPLTRDRQPRTFARAWLQHDTVFLAWPDVTVDDSVRAALAFLCAKVTRIGHSSSFVQMWLATQGEIPEPNWVPDENRAVIHLRIAGPGTLEDLSLRYNGDAVEKFAALNVAAADAPDKKAQREAKRRLKEEFSDEPPTQLRPELSFSQGYALSVQSEPVPAVAGTVISPHLLVFKLEPENAPYRHLDLPAVLALSKRWHDALLSKANDLSDSVRSILSGHDPSGAPLKGPHLAFLPLAFVGQDQHCDGHLLGMALALPSELSREDRRGVLVVIGRVRELVLGRMGVWRIEAERSTRPLRNLRSEAWTGYPSGSTHWSTVTPVVYDRHPKTKDKAAYLEEVADMISQGCLRMGLPTKPREVIVTSVSAHLGVPPAHAFPRLQRKDGSERRHAHAILVFEKPVRGPILIGAGRYRGYGFFRPMTEL